MSVSFTAVILLLLVRNVAVFLFGFFRCPSCFSSMLQNHTKLKVNGANGVNPARKNLLKVSSSSIKTTLSSVVLMFATADFKQVFARWEKS